MVRVVIPKLFMSSRASETQMTRLFIAGLRIGVRGFDTAREYRTESVVGKALRNALAETGVRRENIFVQSRISNEEIIRGRIYDEVRKSADAIGLGYLDCFMFHWPTPNAYLDAWRKLVEIKGNYRIVRNIGICNVRTRHLEEMMCEKVPLPQVVQVEVTPFWQVNDLKSFCDGHEIAMQAFSPLCKMIEPIKSNPILCMLAEKYKVSIPQIILRWNIQRSISPISMTSKVSRVKSNFDITSFVIDDDDMEKIAKIDCGWKYHLESSTCVGF